MVTSRPRASRRRDPPAGRRPGGAAVLRMQVKTCIISGWATMTRCSRPGDPEARRAVLDRLRERNGQTWELCEPLAAMARQSATQHLGVLEAANLITTVRRGREKLHYLNPVPLWACPRERWIARFERPRLRALSAVKPAGRGGHHGRTAELRVRHLYRAHPSGCGSTDRPGLTAQYWGHLTTSPTGDGSRWEHRRVDSSGIARRGRHRAGVRAAASHQRA